MEITYVQTTQSNLNNVPVINGQVIYTSDTGNQYSDVNSSRKRNVFGDEVESVKDMISDAYDSTHTYNVGDYCIHEDVLYKCNTDSTTGTWDSSKWDASTAAGEIKAMFSQIEGLGHAALDISIAESNVVVNLSKSVYDYKMVLIGVSYYESLQYNNGYILAFPLYWDIATLGFSAICNGATEVKPIRVEPISDTSIRIVHPAGIGDCNYVVVYGIK